MEFTTSLELAKKLYPRWFEHEKLIEAMKSLGGCCKNLASLDHTDEDQEVVQRIMQIYDLLEKIAKFNKAQQGRVAVIQKLLENIDNKIVWHQIIISRPHDAPNDRSQRQVPTFEDEDSDADEKVHDAAIRNFNVFEAHRKRCIFGEQLLFETVVTGSIKAELENFLGAIKLEGKMYEKWVCDIGRGNQLEESGLDLPTARKAVLSTMKARIQKHRDEGGMTGTQHNLVEEDDFAVLGRAEKEEQLRIENELLKPAVATDDHLFEHYNPDNYADAELRTVNKKHIHIEGEAVHPETSMEPQQSYPNLCDSESSADSYHPALIEHAEQQPERPEQPAKHQDEHLGHVSLAAQENTRCIACKTFGKCSAASCWCDFELSLPTIGNLPAPIAQQDEKNQPTVDEGYISDAFGDFGVWVPRTFHRGKSGKKACRDWYLEEDGRRVWKNIPLDEQQPFQGPVPAPVPRHKV